MYNTSYGFRVYVNILYKDIHYKHNSMYIMGSTCHEQNKYCSALGRWRVDETSDLLHHWCYIIPL